MDKKIRIPSQKRSINKSQKILETARQLFSQKNYFDVTTNEIAKKSSVSIGTLYSYFSNKEDILVALLK
ncbi:TetR/AcrR family transcriptional regulator, partial [Streptococcus agalactiae]